MQYFSTVIPYVLWMLAYIGVGFLVVKARWGESAHGRTVSGILIYICAPAMVLRAFQTMPYDAAEMGRVGLFFLVSLLIQLLIIGLMCLLLHKRYVDARYRILSISTVLGNVGFLGLPLVTSLFPEQPIVACYGTAYVLSMNLIVFTVGVFLITRDKRYMSLRAAVLNPTTLSILAALMLYLVRVRLPEGVMDQVNLLARMTTPLCMIVLGMRLAAVDLKALFTRPYAYVGSLLKLIAYPLAAYLCVYFIPGLDRAFKASILVLSAVPSASIVLSLAELHRCEQENAASTLLMSTLLCAVTIPLVLLVL